MREEVEYKSLQFGFYETWKWARKARYNTYIEIADYQHDEFVSIFRVIVKMRVVPIKKLKRLQSIV